MDDTANGRGVYTHSCIIFIIFKRVLDMMVNGRMISKMDMELNHGLMVHNMR